MSVNVFALSDEELLKLDLDTLEKKYAEENAAPADDQSGAEAVSEEAAEPEMAEEAQPEAEAAAEDEREDEAAAEGEAVGEQAEDEAEATNNGEKSPFDGQAKTDPVADKAPVEKPEAKDSKPADESAVNYEAEYKKLLSPFTANGREMSVKDVDEAIQLMQMGANYNKKMQALKPNLKLIKLLEQHDLMSEEKLGYLIDLANKDAGAINKLVKDSGLDPMDLSAEKADEYRPKVRTVNEKELELDSVLQDIQESKNYERTLNVVGREWDAASRKVVADHPQLLKIINTHMENGVFDTISAEVERERMFGRLQGMSDIEAYRQVGDAIQARGGFDRLGGNRNTQGQQSQPTKPVVVQPKPREDDERLKEKRRAAAPAKPSAASSKVSADVNFLALSDEEFMKMAKPSY